MAPEYRSDAQVRETLREHLARSRYSCAELSRVIRRGDGYVHDYLHRGTPARLDPGAAGRIARYMGIPERALGVMSDEAKR